jgi:holliday junction DNA helicase RuvA
MMIRLVKGVVASVHNNHVVVETASGIGYLVTVTKRLLVIPGDIVTLHTHLAVRETALDLYGFTDTTDLELFELLLTISGVGPKSALQILDQADRSLILEGIKLEDPAHLSKLSGLSKKTAEKIVLGLKDKIDTTIITNVTPSTTTAYQDAFDTLVTLGYNPVSVRHVLDTMISTNSTSTLVKDALRQLS